MKQNGRYVRPFCVLEGVSSPASGLSTYARLHDTLHEPSAEHIHRKTDHHERRASNLRRRQVLIQKHRSGRKTDNRHEQRERRDLARRIARQQAAPETVAEQRAAIGNHRDAADQRRCRMQQRSVAMKARYTTAKIDVASMPDNAAAMRCGPSNA
jgi:hypothetical protein